MWSKSKVARLLIATGRFVIIDSDIFVSSEERGTGCGHEDEPPLDR